MNTIISIEEACDVIYQFADANQTDPLTGIELMVKYFKQLSPKEQQSLMVFMDKTKVVDKELI
jgi:hypothetical protein